MDEEFAVGFIGHAERGYLMGQYSLRKFLQQFPRIYTPQKIHFDFETRHTEVDGTFA